MTKAELERIVYKPKRVDIIRELKEHIREKTEVEELDKLSNKEFSPDDLKPYVSD